MRLSLVVMAYRQEAFIAETVAAAFAQDHPDLEIVLTDDCSPDDTFRIMSDMAAAYTGPHRIVLNRNPQNLGLIGHVNRLFDLATSDWLIYNAGDDISEPRRARVIAEAIARDDPRYVYSNVTDMDAAGVAQDRQRQRTRPEALQQKSLPDLAKAISHALGASSAWHRDLFDRFGPITETELFEDRILMFRARLLGRVTWLEDRLLRYRRSIGLSFQSRDDRVRQLRQDLATLRQRRADVLHFCPDRRDILKAIARKEERRQHELDDVLSGRQSDLPADEDDA
ncbi:glycosyltransferase family 2 protein [Tabrizicola flagellatus]|uniref:glycosyltransferase family 2 protein n=1 Tax=Tabrizicola flagellatus TaxID=2593021 RepID=UPI0011F2F213|nr:glycosyltransferase [Tabrizicola flagellatus]